MRVSSTVSVSSRPSRTSSCSHSKTSVRFADLGHHRDAKHVEWVRAYTAILDEMRKYVMEYHTTGLVWNAKVRTYHSHLPQRLNGSTALRAYR